MSPLEKYEHHLSKLSRQQDTLETASSVDEAKDNLIQLHAIANKLLKIEHSVMTNLNKMQISLQHKNEAPLASSLFQKSKRKKQESERVQLVRRIKHYELMLTGVNAVRSVVGQVTIPNLETYIAQNQLKQQKPKYYEYLRSDEWREKAERAKAEAGNRCQTCNRSRAETQLEAHHRTYEHLGNERPGDITVLCRDCHQLFEDNKKATNSIKKCKKCGKSFTPQKSSYYHCPSCYRSEHGISYQNINNSKPLIVNEAKGLYSTTPQKGFCIRCHKQVNLNPSSPYCYSCYKSWKQYENKQYKEKFCHICGENHKTSMPKPACLRCYRKHHGKL